MISSKLGYLSGKRFARSASMEMERLEERTLMSADLSASVDFHPGSFPDGLVGGDRPYIDVVVTNIGDVRASKIMRSNFYLSTDQTLDDQDVLLASNVRMNVNLKPGRHDHWKTGVNVPFLEAGSYYVIIDVNTTGTIVEDDYDNNVAVSPDTQDVTYIFGNYHRKHITLTLTDTSSGQDVPVTFSASGNGYGVIAADSTEDSPGYSIEMKYTDCRTNMYVTPEDGESTSISSLYVYRDIGKVSAIDADLTGNMYVGGTAGSVTLGNVGNVGSQDNVSITIDGNSGRWVDFDLGYVTNASLYCDQSIDELKAIDWIDDGGAKDTIDAPTIDHLRITGSESTVGDFEADVNVTGDSHHWNPYIGDIWVDGTVRDAIIRSDGDIDSVSVGASLGSSFLAGVEDNVTQPVSLDDFFVNHWDDAVGRIGEFDVRGLDDSDAAFFEDSNIAAGSIGTVDLKNVQYDNGGADFGIYAEYYNDWGDPIHRVTLRESGGWSADLYHHDFPYTDTDFEIRIV